MKTFPARKWLKLNAEKNIKLTLKDVARIGNDNTRKLIHISQKTNKQVSILSQYGFINRNK